MKSAIYIANTSTTTGIQSGSTLPLGSVIRRFGNNIRLDGSSLLIEGQGYYDVDVNVTFSPSAIGNYTIQLLKDGSPIQGALALVNTSVTTTVAFHTLVREMCCDDSSVLSLVITSSVPTNTVILNNLGIVVEKI
jgi:hypothetical protein